MVEHTTASDRGVPHQPSSAAADVAPSGTATTSSPTTRGPATEATPADDEVTEAGSAHTKVTTEGSAQVLNEVKGRLERMETGELPVIERIGPDGSTRRVDPTGEMIRPQSAHLAAVNEAAEQFAAQHRAAGSGSSPTPTGTPVASGAGSDNVPARTGLWARIMGWFRRT